MPRPQSHAPYRRVLLSSAEMRARTDLVTIQAWLGHAQVATTHRYAEADVEMMRKSLKEADVTGDSSDRISRPTTSSRFSRTPEDNVARHFTATALNIVKPVVPLGRIAIAAT